MDLETAKILRRDMGPYGYEGIIEYAKYRISVIHKSMETANPEDLRKLQGAIEELRLLFKIKDYASNLLDKGKN